MDRKTIKKMKAMQSSIIGLQNKLAVLHFRVALYGAEHKETDKFFRERSEDYFKKLWQGLGEVDELLSEVILKYDPDSIF